MANNLLVNLLGAWKLDETVITATRVDSHTTGNDMLVENGFILLATGIKDGGCDFGTDTANRLARPDDGTFDLGSTSFSMGCWFKQPANQNNPFLGKWHQPSSNQSWRFWQRSTNDKVRFGVSSSGSNETFVTPASGTTPDNVWNFCTAGFDAVNEEIWIQINAVARATLSYTAGIFIANVSLTMGWVEGTIKLMGNQAQDETYIWDKYITSDEHDTMYDSGTGLFFESFDGVSATMLDMGTDHYRRHQRLQTTGRKS